MHEAALGSVSLEGEYRLYPVPPLPTGEVVFDEMLSRLRSGALQGLNVTIPHKQTAFRKVDALTLTAQAVGAVNTLYLKEGVLWGENTDVKGFIHDLEELASGPRSALVLGAGGAARAVVYGLAEEGCSVIYIAARRLIQAEQLVASLAPVFHSESRQAEDFPGTHKNTVRFVPMILNPASLAGITNALDLVVNATSVGMSPQVDFSPWPAQLLWPNNAAAYDLVYNPADTRFLQTARTTGAPVHGGIGMLVEQAALAFERWTGKRPLENR